MRRQPSFTRAARLEHLMLVEVEQLLAYEVRSPLAQRVKVVGVRLSPDLGHLRVQYILHDGEEPFPALDEVLQKAAPFVGRTLAETFQLQKRLQVAFAFEKDAQQAQKVQALLKESGTAPAAGAGPGSGSGSGSGPVSGSGAGSEAEDGAGT